jgi:predicted negative regulator of RcsB-dependent stress response
LTEQEQIQQLKNWAKQYGPTILAGIILAIALTSGWRYWQNYKTKILTQASQIYDEMLGLKAQNNMAGSENKAKQLIADYAKSPYAPIAALLLADNAVQKTNYADAHMQLTWAMDHAKDKSMRAIARLRNARILIAENKPQEALNILKTAEDTNFLGLINAVKGDAYLALNEPAKARLAFRSALEELPLNDPGRPLLQMKYDNLAGTN